MMQIIRVQTTIGPDLRAKSVLTDMQTLLGKRIIQDAQSVAVYRLEGVSEKDAKHLAEMLLHEDINQTYSLNKPLLNGSARVIEIAYKPGVMNPEVASILKAAKDLKIKLFAADASREYGFHTTLTKDMLHDAMRKLHIFNPTVEHIVDKEPTTLLIKGTVGKTTIIPLRNMNNDQLLALSQDKLFLNLAEMQVIQKYFQKIKRDPTDCELETIAQTWSEHCAHKTFKANIIADGKKKQPFMSRIKKEALKHDLHIVSAFIDNSGVMDFYDGMCICGKVETHNSPSAIEPYGGAMTGSGGVFRDVLGTGQGAKNIISTDMFCFANPDMSNTKLPPGCLPPSYLLKRVVAGVRDYGNRMGIPTNNGSLHFHDDFRAKPTVIVGAYGILPKKYAQKGKPKIDDLVVTVGGRTGRDGIHGATFSSAEMTDKTITINSSAVQIGNAIEEKRMFDAIIEARDNNLIRAMQDCGAGGFSSAIGEMGEKTGVTVHLEKASLKYQGLAPWEIWVSESQERMVLAIPKNNIKIFLKICQKYNTEATILGKFDGSKKLNIYYAKKKVADLSMDFLHHGLPQRTMIAKKEKQVIQKRVSGKLPQTKTAWITILKKILSHGNIASKEPIVRLYDHSVQGTNVLQSYSGALLDGPNDAVVIKPLLHKPYGMIVAHGLNPVLNIGDPYWGSIWAATEAISNYVAVGGDYKNASLINNYIWPFPDEESLYALDQCVDAVIDFMHALKIPVISGKDSLSSTYRGKDGTVINIPPVLCMSVFGKIPDVSKTVTADFKKEASVICLVGKQDLLAMGESVYTEVAKQHNKQVPQIDLKVLPKVLATVYKSIQKGKILSCHDVSEGGIFTAIFEMCVGGNMGARISLDNRVRPDFFLFNETAGCFAVEITDEKTTHSLFKTIPYTILGKTQKTNTITMMQKNNVLFDAEIDSLKTAWQEPMRKLFP